MEILLLLFSGIPTFLLCRFLWYAGTWFKRQTRLEYNPEDYE